MAASRVVASAPSRIDLAGGTLDIWPLSVLVPGACTVNLAVELRASATVEALAGRKVRIRSVDRGRRLTRSLPLSGEPGSALPLLERLVRAWEPSEGLSLTTRATAPAGAGLGGSSTLAVAVGGALARFLSGRRSREHVVRRVMNHETVQLGVPTGNQDYLAAWHGGLSAFHHECDGTRREALEVPPGLAARLVLAYTGQPRDSGFSNWEMFRRFVDGERTTVRRMHAIAAIAGELRAALVAGDLDAAGRAVGREGRLRYRLAPSVGTPALLAADAAARKAGALGVKVCGAGGGGCLVAFAREGRAEAVREAVASTGAQILPCRVATRGLRVEVSRSKPGS